MIDDNKSVRDVVEIGLGSIGKIKIIRALAEENKLLTVYSIQKKTRLKREDIKRNLNELIKIGWVKEHKIGNSRMYTVNKENQYVKRLIICFFDMGYIEQIGQI